MVKDRKELERYLNDKCLGIAVNNKKCQVVYDYANETYKIPKTIVLDLITQRVNLENASDFQLFILLDSIKQVIRIGNTIKDYFDDDTIEDYKSKKYNDNEVEFPLKLKMIRIENDQWIGRIDAKTLIKFRNAKLINYNENIQRGKVNNSKFKVGFVKIIINAFSNRTHIPSTITLNIPLEEDSEFCYDEEKNLLAINKLDHFDIIDGYTRYISLCSVCDTNNNYNCTMELRITNFSEEKAKQFRFQEEQKHYMTRQSSTSFDMSRPENQVIKKLNDNPEFCLKGKIGRGNEYIINYDHFSKTIGTLFYHVKTMKEKDKIPIDQLVNNLIEFFNKLIKYDDKYLTNKISNEKLSIIMICFRYYNDKSNIYEIIDKLLKKFDNGEIKINLIRFIRSDILSAKDLFNKMIVDIEEEQ